MIRRLTLAAALALLATWMAIPVARAADCPPECVPRTPTCAERITRAKKAGCEMPKEIKEVPINVPCSPCKDGAAGPVGPPGPSGRDGRDGRDFVPTPPAPTGHTFVALGPVWRDSWGATMVAGHFWPNGWGVMGGPLWLPSHDANGTVTNCQDDRPGVNGGSHGCGCVTLPYSVPAPSPWGAQIFVGYSFR